MSTLPFTLPTCDRPAAIRLEVYSPANGRLHGSLDAVVYACAEHAVEAVSAIEAAGLTAYRWSAPGVDINRGCGYAHVFAPGTPLSTAGGAR
ncbi:hypothetical protein [Micromonospora sp. RTGN7]|uniref:hypothetical protein n=1 Tax=Micromonospora sp. RTGN7 TaxID=3016526 RepID=UPI0029FEDCD3|nr:hypothetical protein [Micromonospora sp. RTGN7]